MEDGASWKGAWAAAALAVAVAGAGCAGAPDGFAVDIQSFGVTADCGENVASVTATVVLDDVSGDRDAHVVPVRVTFDVLGQSLRVPLEGDPTDLAPGEARAIDVAGAASFRGGVCDACGPGPAPLVAPTFEFRVNGERLEALAPPSMLVCR